MTEEEFQERESEKEQKKAERQRNAANNAQALRVAAKVAENTPEATIATAGKIVSTADKLTGGKSTELLGHAMNLATPKPMQGVINKAAESGALDAAGKVASATGGNNNTQPSGTATQSQTSNQNTNTNAQQKNSTSTNSADSKSTTTQDVTVISDGEETKKAIPILGIIIAIPAVFLLFSIISVVMLIISVFSTQSYSTFKYGTTCTTVTVTDTGCDRNAKNCTHIYDGDVSFEDYVAGVVAAEVGSANNLEYYKIAAISARTFFLNHVDSSCTVKGNASYQAYMDVEKSPYAETIKQAVEETEGQVLVKNDELAPVYYASACVVDADDEYYYVRYGTLSLGEANFQKIPKEWDSDSSHAYSGYLRSWYSEVNQSDPNLETKSCPNNHDYAMSQLGALYLITGENYDYEQVMEYYYGEDTEIMVNDMQLSGVDGFVNPTRYINCTSAFGWRIHPVQGTKKFHQGLDIGISGGEPIYAAADGIVKDVRTTVNSINNCNFGYGNYVQIDHGDGMSTLYAHIKYGTIPSSITVGASVSQGEQIGEVGSTGCSTGNHLHYEVRQNGKQVDPADYLDLTGATGTCRR